MKVSRSFETLAVVSALAIAFLAPAVATAEDKVIASVNGYNVTESEMALAEADLGAEISTLQGQMRRRVLVEYIIENRLFAEAAEADKLGTGPDFEKRVQFWRQRALRDAYYEKTVKSSIGEAAAKGIYEDRVKSLPVEEEVQARHILVKSEDEAKKIAEKITAGGDFAALAKENSGDAGSKEQGGMLGYFGKGQMVPEFETAAFAMKKGEVSKPVQSNFGWHVIKVEDRRQKPPPTFDDVKDRIMSTMVQSKAQDIVTGLRSKAKIEYIDPDMKKMAEEDAKKQAEAKAAMDKQMQDQLDKAKAMEKVAPPAEEKK